MLLILHNLPKEVTSLDVRQLIQERCGFRDLILDNLLDEGPGKRITVGLVEEEDAAILMRKMNGLRYKNCQLYVKDVRKKKSSTLSYQVLVPAGLQPKTPNLWFQNPVQMSAETLQVNKSNMPYYMTQDSNNMNYGKPTQTIQNTSIFNRNYQSTSNAVFQALKPDTLQICPFTASNSNEIQAPDNSPSYRHYQNDRDKQGYRRDNTAQTSWRENKSPPSKRHENFGNFSQRESRFGDKNYEWNKSNESSRRSRDRDRSFREYKKDDRRHDFDNSRRSGSSRSNPRDKDSYQYEPNSDREQINHFSSQTERVFEQHERRSDQKRNYEPVNRNARDNVQKRSYQQVDRDVRDNVQKRNYEQVVRDARDNVKKRNYDQVDRDARDNVQKRNYEQVDRNTQKPERSFANKFETSTTFSSKPENSSFSKPNRSIFDKIIASRSFGETNKNKAEVSSPKQNTSKSHVNSSAAKQARFDPPQYFGNRKYINPNATTNKTTDLQKLMTRHTNWCIQSATLLAKEILKNASEGKVKNTIFKPVLKKLRECILSRLDVILGDKMATNLDEILRGYRTKFNFNDDTNFLNAVLEKVEREIKENADEVTGPTVDKGKQHYQESGILNKGPSLINPYYSSNAKLSEKKQQNEESGKIKKGPSVINPYYSPISKLTPNPVATGTKKGFMVQNRPQMPFIKDPMTLPRLPRYPHSDKQGFKQLKKTALLEHEEGFFTLEPEFAKTVEEEVEKLVKCYIDACEPSVNENEENIRNKIITSSVDEFKNIIKLQVTKRVLNITDGLTLRIISTPKPPPKAALDAFLKSHGAISLKKSDTSKMFVANCDSYESYDRLLALRTTNFGHITIHFKPYQVMGPVTKKNKKSNQVINANAVEDFTKDVDELKLDITNDSNDDPDLLLLENDQSEVVVIRDDEDQTINSESQNENVNENNKAREINDLEAPNSNDKIAASDENNDKSNEVDNSDTQVNVSNEKVQGSVDKVPNSETEEQINVSDKNVTETSDDILNVDEILEEDLEDF